MKFLTRNWKQILIGILVLALGVSAFLFWPLSTDVTDRVPASYDYDVRILRDTYGVPHVFGVTDADAAFGLAYAHAEDDFLTIQQTLAAARGLLGAIYGPDAAPNDYMVQLLRMWEVVDAEYNTLAPQTRAVMEAYANGVNLYAREHPGDVLIKDLYPLSGKDIAAASVHKSPLFFGLDGTLGDLFREDRDEPVSPRPTSANPFDLLSPARWAVTGQMIDTQYGSNVLAVSPARSANGDTYLAVNSHQPWTGPVAWYEAHVHSEEGWDAVGALFPATPAIIHGHNRELGWAFTVNSPDLIDVYVLDIHPDDPNQYRFDGEWRTLEVQDAPIRVKLLGNLTWTVKQEVLWSEYGPTVRQDHGTYAIRYTGYGRVDIFEQLYRMNKATTFEAWRAALADGGLPMFNVGYADREGNIFYAYNAELPVRPEGWDWTDDLPGDTSANLWTGTLPFEQLPQVLNPAAGIIQNANSSPFQTTLGAGNPDEADYSPAFGIETYMTNRSLRALELLGGDDEITFDEFLAYKYDMAYSEASAPAQYRERLLNAEFPAGEDVTEALDLLRNWDLSTHPESTSASLMLLTLYDLDATVSGFSGSRLMKFDVTDDALVTSFLRAIEQLQTHHGRLDVPWGEINRLRRGTVDIPIGGAPDVLHAVYGDLDEGTITGTAGDSYVLMVRWDAQGQVESQSIHQFGAATLDETSPHYADQAALFAARKLKPVWLDEVDILANLEREYRPGE